MDRQKSEETEQTNWWVTLQRILDDADATLPSLGAPRLCGAAETYYHSDPTPRLQYGQAFATQAAQNSPLQRVSFWTTPDGGGPGQNDAYPFTIEDYLPPSSLHKPSGKIACGGLESPQFVPLRSRGQAAREDSCEICDEIGLIQVTG